MRLPTATFSIHIPRLLRPVLWLAAGASLGIFLSWLNQKPFIPSRSVDAIGLPAPEIRLQDISGQWVSLSDFRGRPVLVNFWATWCTPCWTEMPNLVAQYEKFKDTQGLVVLAVNIQQDAKGEAIQAYIRKFKMTFPILLDDEGKAGVDYRMRGIPMTIFIDRYGFIRDFVVGGPMGQEFIEQELKKIF